MAHVLVFFRSIAIVCEAIALVMEGRRGNLVPSDGVGVLL